jgi:hypothetical protein
MIALSSVGAIHIKFANKMTKKHIHAEFIHAFADGEDIQYYNVTGFWVDVNPRIPTFYENTKYRIKPKTININGFEVPEPCREPLQRGDEYCIADVSSGNGHSIQWNFSELDIKWLRLGIIHKTKEAADLHSTALLSFTRIEANHESE